MTCAAPRARGLTAALSSQDRSVDTAAQTAAAAPVVQSSRACRELNCGRPVEGRDTYCYDHKRTRRAITFARQIEALLEEVRVRRFQADEPRDGILAALEHNMAVLEELGG